MGGLGSSSDMQWRVLCVKNSPNLLDLQGRTGASVAPGRPELKLSCSQQPQPEWKKPLGETKQNYQEVIGKL